MTELPRAERCDTCRYWDGGTGMDGLCRRYPPSVPPDEGDYDWFPKTQKFTWCGEYQPATVAPPAPGGG